jgi:hypothetical protein
MGTKALARVAGAAMVKMLERKRASVDLAEETAHH